MDNKNLDKALEIVSILITGEDIRRDKDSHISLYEEYSSNAGVSELVRTMIKKLNLSLYEYNNGLYLTAGEDNRVFGYSNEELKKAIGIKRNRELYLCYFIIYHIITEFYKDSATYTYIEYVRIEDVIHGVDNGLGQVISKLDILVETEMEENSFNSIAILWEDMPIVTGEEGGGARAARNSKAGYVKMVLNFLLTQSLFVESEERYYPTERMKALIQNYFEEFQGRLFQIMKGEEDHAAY